MAMTQSEKDLCPERARLPETPGQGWRPETVGCIKQTVCVPELRSQIRSTPEAQGGRAANQYELPLGWNGLLPLVADLCEKLNDVRG